MSDDLQPRRAIVERPPTGSSKTIHIGRVEIGLLVISGALGLSIAIAVVVSWILISLARSGVTGCVNAACQTEVDQIAREWTGELVRVAATGFLSMAVVLVLAFLVVSAIDRRTPEEHYRRTPLTVAVGLAIVIAALTLWALVGDFRAAEERIFAAPSEPIDPGPWSTEADEALTLPSPGVLADTDLSDPSVTEYDSRSTAGAMVRVVPEGGFTYNPRGASQLRALQAGEKFADTFRYSVTHDDGTTVGTAEVIVTGVAQD